MSSSLIHISLSLIYFSKDPDLTEAITGLRLEDAKREAKIKKKLSAKKVKKLTPDQESTVSSLPPLQLWDKLTRISGPRTFQKSSLRI